MSTEKFNLILKDYPEEMKKSDKRRTIYLHESDPRLPATVTSSLSRNGKEAGFKYYIDAIGWIYDAVTDEKVIRNTKTAGKPNMQKISGQSIWNGAVDMYARNSLKKFLTEYFRPAIARMLPQTLVTPAGEYFHFEFLFYVPIVARKWTVQDIDNHAYPYVKSFLDTVVEMKVITDDSSKYFRGYYPRYINCQTEEERRLEIKIHFCKNDERIS